MSPQSFRYVSHLPRVLLVLVCLWSGGGCATYHVYQAGGPDGRELGNQPGTEWKGETLHSLFWGAIRQDLPVTNCRLGNGTRTGIEEVRIQSNLGATIATILTLGLWQPLKIGWRCIKPPAISDTL